MQNVMSDGLAVLVDPHLHSDGITYLLDLYEALMSSIGREGTLKNFRNNVCALKEIVINHWGTASCIQDLSADRADDRKAFFEPIFEADFSKDDL